MASYSSQQISELRMKFVKKSEVAESSAAPTESAETAQVSAEEVHGPSPVSAECTTSVLPPSAEDGAVAGPSGVSTVLNESEDSTVRLDSSDGSASDCSLFEKHVVTRQFYLDYMKKKKLEDSPADEPEALASEVEPVVPGKSYPVRSFIGLRFGANGDLEVNIDWKTKKPCPADWQKHSYLDAGPLNNKSRKFLYIMRMSIDIMLNDALSQELEGYELKAKHLTDYLYSLFPYLLYLEDTDDATDKEDEKDPDYHPRKKSKKKKKNKNKKN